MSEDIEQGKVWLRFVGGEGAPQGTIGEMKLLPPRHANFNWWKQYDFNIEYPVHKGHVRCLKTHSSEAPLYSVVVPVSNLYGRVVRNCLKGLELQSFKSMEVIVVDYGSTDENHEKLLDTLEPFDCTVYFYPGPLQWSSTVSRNIGIRRARGMFVGTLDADCILEPGAAEQVMDLFRERQDRMVVQSPCFLSEDISGDVELPEAYPLIKIEKSNCMYYGQGIGAYVNAPRHWWHKVKGHDERFVGWGPNDLNLWKRAGTDALMERVKIVRKLPGKMDPGVLYHILNEDTVCYHQWHEGGRFRRLIGSKRFEKVKELNENIHKYATTLVRNNESWGIP